MYHLNFSDSFRGPFSCGCRMAYVAFDSIKEFYVFYLLFGMLVLFICLHNIRLDLFRMFFKITALHKLQWSSFNCTELEGPTIYDISDVEKHFRFSKAE